MFPRSTWESVPCCPSAVRSLCPALTGLPHTDGPGSKDPQEMPCLPHVIPSCTWLHPLHPPPAFKGPAVLGLDPFTRWATMSYPKPVLWPPSKSYWRLQTKHRLQICLKSACSSGRPEHPRAGSAGWCHFWRL